MVHTRFYIFFMRGAKKPLLRGFRVKFESLSVCNASEMSLGNRKRAGGGGRAKRFKAIYIGRDALKRLHPAAYNIETGGGGYKKGKMVKIYIAGGV